MKRCCNPDHPHCTVWVMPGDSACAHGHPQPEPAPAAGAAGLGSSFDMISTLRGERARNGAAIMPQSAPAAALQRPQLHVSGFDPRAAGGRQAIKLELRGMPMDCTPKVTMLVQSALFLHGGATCSFTRTLRGDFRPLFLEFSSRGLEHGQYRIELELHSRHENAPGAARTWACTLVILVPRADASLGEIHETFLSTYKNVRVTADDAGIARVNAPTGGGRLDIDVTARNASIAHLNLEAQSGKTDLGLATIAWDEDLIEIDVPVETDSHPFPASAACLVDAEPDAGAPRHIRLFALDEFVLGRFEAVQPEADVLLAHHGERGLEPGGLTRRLSGRHALIRRGRDGFEIEDVSRYGLLLDGVWPGKHKPVPLRLGMRIELSASIKGIVVLEVTALLPHGVILHRVDQGAQAECFYLLEPERRPGSQLATHPAAPRAMTLPLLFHQHGGFWHLDRASGAVTALTPSIALERLGQCARHMRFAGAPYPENWAERDQRGEHRRARMGALPLDA